MISLKGELNKEQLRAVNSCEGAVLILAGAGSGKTRVITYRILRMLEKGIPQSAILALTFTNKAAREMENRVRELCTARRYGKKLRNLTIGTFHAFGVKLLREEIEILGYRKNFSIYDSTDRIELIKESLRECRLYGEKTDLKKIESLFSSIKIGRLKWGRPSESKADAANIADNTFEPAYNEYQKSLKVYNALDFDDLLILPIQLFLEHNDILEKYRRRFRYIMVDEFQDTSLVQYELLRLLAKNDAGESNVCIVGDDDQSIYSWRGANYENLLLFENDFPNALLIKLEQNYRSTTTILEAANGLISHNASRMGKVLWSGKGEGRPIELFSPKNESGEAGFIAGKIQKLRFAEKRNFSHFGILVRTNNQFDVLEEALLSHNIPYNVSGGTSFFERREVRDVLSYMRIIANPNDDISLLRIVNTPRRGIGKAAIKTASSLARKNNSSLHDSFRRLVLSRDTGQGNLFGADIAVKEQKNSSHGIEDFLELIDNLREEFFSGADLSKNVRKLIDKIDYWGFLVSENSKDEKKARWKYSNLEYLIKMIEDWEKDPDNPDRGLYAYLNRISLISRNDGEEPDSQNKVSLMTIHASKGLEFPVVFIAGAEEGIIPHERSIEEGDNAVTSLEEERRLFYVAITRAMEKLCITSCRKRSNRQTENDKVPSPFLSEIPAHLIAYINEEEETPGETGSLYAMLKENLT